MYFRQYWNDSRLTFRPADNFKEILIPRTDYESLYWRPDSFFVNERRTADPGTKEAFTKLMPTGEVMRSQRY